MGCPARIAFEPLLRRRLLRLQRPENFNPLPQILLSNSPPSYLWRVEPASAEPLAEMLRIAGVSRSAAAGSGARAVSDLTASVLSADRYPPCEPQRWWMTPSAKNIGGSRCALWALTRTVIRICRVQDRKSV